MNSNQDFTQGSIFRKMIRFMLPILGALILQAMYSAVDLFVVGKFGTDEGISGVATGANIMHMPMVLVAALTTGITVLMGHYLGEGKKEKIGRLLGNSVCFFLALSAVLSLVLIFCAKPLALLMQAPKEAVDLTAQYIRINGYGFVFVIFYNFISAVFRGMGNSRLPLLFVLIACIVNIGGDLLLIKGFGMNVAGAAIATVAAQAVSVLISLVVIRKQKMPFEFSFKDITFGPEIPRFIRIATPLAIQDLLTNFTFLALNAFINRLGIEASSGYGIAQRVQSFVMLLPSSLMQCMAAFVAQNVGAGNEKRAQQAMKTGMLMGASIGVFIGLLAFFKGDLLASIFSDNEMYIARAFEYLRGFSPEAVVTCIMFSFLGYFNGHARSSFVMAQGLIQSFLFRLPISYIMSIQPNASLTWVGAAAPAATCVGIILCFCYYRWINRKGHSPILQKD